ncbi:type III-B CRISPR module RAMP protein Cmr6 [Thermotoga sp. SG1]|uniref:type III-B CRISPR module RAMP protein Cmr6 n=1 Tax=Thermotoga sp. SG1 TaxID=126739 RepID=UPI001E293AD9|nr:type III-B CRISPR module RAMP protein Cmr6 [Thermotoga sp. SG1]
MIDLLQNLKEKKYILDILQTRRKLIHEKRKPIINLKMKVRSKLLVGAGSPSPVEVGITLSRNYGVPVIPGSAIKGTFASFLYENGEFDKFSHIFGDEEKEGALIFLDAIPVSDLRLSVDIINPHFQPYYMQEKSPPNDWYDPVPVKYIVVGEGIFQFTVLEDLERSIKDSEKKEIKERFIEMLKVYGLGAKTNYGYGRFNDVLS